MKNPVWTLPVLALTLAVGASLPAAAQHMGGHHSSHATPTPAPVQPGAEMVAGEVRKIDAPAKKITLKHGEIKSIGMPPMTMAYDLKDEALAKDLKVGDAVQFSAVAGPGGSYLVTELRRAK